MKTQAGLGAILVFAMASAVHAGGELPHHSRQSERATLEGRVAIYAQALNLDASQQVRLRALLMLQKDQVQQVWNDTSLTAAARVHATKVIGDATGDRIRAMLTDEQRKKYNPPRPPKVGNARADVPSVETWINGMGK
jgi:hypothetical protein